MCNPWKDKSLIMALKDILKSGALGLGAGVVADNPKLLHGFGLAGNIAANKIENRADDKRMAAEAEAKAMAEKKKRPMRARPQSTPMGGGLESYKPMKKGGSVSSASKRGDGCAIKGKTKGRMV
jgi:hypothetical protein